MLFVFAVITVWAALGEEPKPLRSKPSATGASPVIVIASAVSKLDQAFADALSSGDPAEPTRWRFPDNEPDVTTIGPGRHLIVWADEEVTDGGVHPMFKLHASFKLDASGDEVCLFAADGTTLIDRLTFGEQTADVSFGRYPDGGDTLRFFGLPTPGQPNNEGYLGEVAPLRFSHERGFYDGTFDLVITCATEGAEIIYTTNGRVPNDESGRFPPGRPYTAPLRIGTTTCLRAMAIKPGWKPSKVYTHTYILGASESIRSLISGIAAAMALNRVRPLWRMRKIAPVQRLPMSSTARWNRGQRAIGWCSDMTPHL